METPLDNNILSFYTIILSRKQEVNYCYDEHTTSPYDSSSLA